MMSDVAPTNGGQGEIIGRMKAKIKELSGKLQEATEARVKAVADLELAGKASGPLQARIAELEGTIRTDRHKAAFNRLAKAAGVREKATDALYQLSGWKADKDDVDEAGLQATLARLKESHDYAFEPDPQPDGQAGGQIESTSPKIFPAPPAAGRGPAHQPSKTGVLLTRAQMADPKFMLNPANKEIIESAARERRIEGAIGDTKARR